MTVGWQRAVAAIVLGCGAALGLAGATLAASPDAGHAWLLSVERVVPAVRGAFLTRYERGVYADSEASIARGTLELGRLDRDDRVDSIRRARAHELRDALRATMTGDAVVIAELTRHARQRQRYAIGIPLAGCGAVLLWSASRRRAQRPGMSGAEPDARRSAIASTPRTPPA